MVTVFFPNNATYIMVGLEPAGTLPSPKQLGRKSLDQYLGSVRATVASELGRSFFITRQMDRQFRGQVTDGLILPILELLVRSNHTVLGFRYVRLDDAGKAIERTADYRAPGKIGDKGVEIDFRQDDDQSIHKLMYFSVNLSNTGLRENQAFLAFVGGLKGTATLLKATSYMTHKRNFRQYGIACFRRASLCCRTIRESRTGSSPRRRGRCRCMAPTTGRTAASGGSGRRICGEHILLRVLSRSVSALDTGTERCRRICNWRAGWIEGCA